MSPARWPLAAAIAFLVVALAGCSDNGGAGTDPTAKDGMTPTEQLLARPNAEQAATMYKNQLVRVRAALKKLAPNVEWDNQEPAKVGETACQDPFGRIEGTTSLSFGTGGGGAISDTAWREVVSVVEDVLADDGYDRVRVIVDRPGQHDVVFTDKYGSVLDVGGEVSTTIDVSTGCFLSPEAHAAANEQTADE